MDSSHEPQSGPKPPLPGPPGAAFPEIHRWWPRLSIRHKHEIEDALAAPLSTSAVEEIEQLLAVSIPRAPHFLSQHDRDFVVTQGEAVD